MKFIPTKEYYKKSGVYCIKNTIDNRLYIGSTIGFKPRFNGHNRTLKINSHQSAHLQNFVNKYGIDKLFFDIIELCEPKDLIPLEQKWINLYDANGLLFNSCKIAGNTLGYKHTPKTIEFLKNRIVSEETKKKQSEWQRGVPKPDELKKKWNDGSRKGKPKSEEFKKMMSEKMKGNKNGAGVIFSKERKKKIGEASSKRMKGKKLSMETKKKISDNSPFKGKKGRKGTPHTEEYKKAMSKRMKGNTFMVGKKHSDETKKKMSKPRKSKN